MYTADESEKQNTESNPYNLTVKNNAILPESTTIGNYNIIDEIRDIKVAIAELKAAQED